MDSGSNKTRVDSGASASPSGGDKRKVKFMDGRGAGGKGDEVVQSLGNGDTDPTENRKKGGNFFDYHEDADTDVWGPKFTSTLRKAR